MFKQTDNITDATLKSKVIKALESKAGKEALQKAFKENREHFRKLFNDDNIITVSDVIDAIDNPKQFKLIFKVY